MLSRIGFFSIFLTFVTVSVSLAQTPPYLWDQRFGDSNVQSLSQLATDTSGDLVLTGLFSGEVDFGGGVLSAGYFKDVFLAKFDTRGNHLWSQRFGDTTHDQTGQSVAIDPSGNILLAGEFTGTIDVGGGLMTSAGGTDIFLAKFSPGGEHVWSQRFGDWALQTIKAVTTDESGNVICTGEFESTVNFGGGPLTCVGGMDDADIFLAKFDEAGIHGWSKRFGSPGYEGGADVAVDPDGNVLLTGQFAETLDFGGDPLVSAGEKDIFLAKLTSSGAHVWSQRFGDSASQMPMSVACDASGNVLIAGTFEGSVDFGGGARVSQGGYDIFVAKFDENGSHLWSTPFGDAALWRQEAHDVAVDPAGNVLLTGENEGTVDFGGGPLVNVGASDIFCAKFDSNGNHVWSRGYGDVSIVNYHSSRSVCPDPWGNAVFAGSFDGSLTFGTLSLISHGNWDIFLAKLIPADDPTGIDGAPAPAVPSITVAPNPFNPNTTIRYAIPSEGVARLVIYDVHGRRVRTLVNAPLIPGAHTAIWDGRDENGGMAASGLYFVRLESGGRVTTGKLVLLK